MEIITFSPANAGCLIDGDQYGVARMIWLAQEYGYSDYDILSLASRKLSSMALARTDDELTAEEEEMLSDSADEVEIWMNENIAPEGYMFGWEDGDFFLNPVAWFESSWEWTDDDDEPDEYEPESNGVDDFNSFDPYDKEYDVP